VSGLAVWSLDARGRLVACPIADVLLAGQREVFTVRLACGRVVEAVTDAPLLTLDGWMPLRGLE
jgi:replicative DNA helicase